MGKLWRRLYYLLHRARFDRELADEMSAHLEMMPASRRGEFGSALRLREQSREPWTWSWMETCRQDLTYGARVLARAPGFALGAVAVLALGVGVNLAEYQIFDAMIFHRLTIRDADAALQFGRVSHQGFRLGFPHAAVEFFRKESHSYAWLLSEDTSYNVVVENDGNLRSNLIPANYFGTLGVVPAWGRLPDARDAEGGAPAVAALGYEYWRSRWAGDPNVVGRVVRINNQPVEIIGVLPYNFEGIFARRTDVWLPVTLRPVLMAGSPPLETDFSRSSEVLFGKLKDGTSRAAGDAELTALARELARREAGFFREDDRIQGQFVLASVIESVRRIPAIAIFMVMVLLVLLSACANLGNMLLARGLVRQTEIGVRMAIGASRARVVRQLMTENLLLALLGSAAGLAFGAAASRLLMVALGAPPGMKIAMRWPVPVAGSVLTLVSTIAFGLPSALQTVRPNHRRIRLRQSLVGVQVAVSCLLLIASGVMAHSGILSASIPLTFDYPKMVVVYPQLYARSLTPAVAGLKLDEMSTRLKSVPGVDGITSAVIPPLGGRVRTETLPGLPNVAWNAVGPSYFEVMNLPFVLGRTFVPGEPNTVIVSESAARAIWPNQNPVGKTWRFAGAERTVAGVVKNSGANVLYDADSVEAYVPLGEREVEQGALILHTHGDPAPLVRMIAAAPATLGETVTVTLMRTGRDNFLAGQRKMVTLIGSIGAVATSLAAAGMFALVAFAVAQRKRELGIRMAIGATGRHILGALLLQNLRPTAVGLIAGAALAAALARLVRSQVRMPNGDSVDLIGFAAGLACFVLVAALASLSPAMRALRIDPSTTLREE